MENPDGLIYVQTQGIPLGHPLHVPYTRDTVVYLAILPRSSHPQQQTSHTQHVSVSIAPHQLDMSHMSRGRNTGL